LSAFATERTSVACQRQHCVTRFLQSPICFKVFLSDVIDYGYVGKLSSGPRRPKSSSGESPNAETPISAP
jgi:hypothetical protein